MIQGFHHLQNYCDYVLNSVQPLVLEKINVLADVRKDTIYIIDISTAWKTQIENPSVNFSQNRLASSALVLSLLFSLLAITFTNASRTAE